MLAVLIVFAYAGMAADGYWIEATNQARRHVWGEAPETISSLGLFP